MTENGPPQPDISFQPYVSEGSIIDSSIMSGARRDGTITNMMSGLTDCSTGYTKGVEGTCPTGCTLSGFGSPSETCSLNNIANKDDVFKEFDLDEMIPNINNGRVSDATTVVENALSQDLFNDVVITRDNQENAVKGIVEESALSNYFFSKMNTDILQDTIRYNVYKTTNLTISRQSENELFIIMRSILLQYGNFRSGFDELKNELLKLNKLVVEYSSEFVSANALQHSQYVNELEKLPTPILFPESTREFNYTYDVSNLL
jgi:hypothetical protein